jgi:hypothetical protein
MAKGVWDYFAKKYKANIITPLSYTIGQNDFKTPTEYLGTLPKLDPYSAEDI